WETHGAGRENGPFDAVGSSVAQDPAWRPERLPLVLRVVRNVVEELLDPGRGVESAQRRQLVRGQLREGTGHGFGRRVRLARRLWQNLYFDAAVVKSVNTPGSGPGGRKPLKVQVLSAAFPAFPRR